jgi:hypothetical protein
MAPAKREVVVMMSSECLNGDRITESPETECCEGVAASNMSAAETFMDAAGVVAEMVLKLVLGASSPLPLAAH